MSEKTLFEQLLLTLPTISAWHAPGTPQYELLKSYARHEVEQRFSSAVNESRDFGPFGDIVFSYYRMGAIDSMDLFGIDELIIFGFYWVNRQRYRRVTDIGANIGLHSLVMDRCGYEVRSYEPDPTHFELLRNNLIVNGCDAVELRQAAVSKADGEAEFIRVLGNTTGSHLAGSKASPYGDLERFPVRIEAIHPVIEWSDFIKIDAEGHEYTILSATESQQWAHCDAMVEVGSEQNAAAIYQLFLEYEVNLFAQKQNWQLVQHLEEMPTSYRDGSLFITSKESMPW